YDALSNLIHRDGYPFESPGYNIHWNREVLHLAKALRPTGVDVAKHPRFAPLMRWPLQLIVAGRFTPALGDSGNMFAGALGLEGDLLESGHRYTDDPAFARAMVQSELKPEHDLFEPDSGTKMLEDAKRHPEPIGINSSILPDTGFATLQTGD